MGITCDEAPTEAHWTIGKLEGYHRPLGRAFGILYSELRGSVSEDAILQIAVKTFNDTAGPEGLLPVLLVFEAYPKVSYNTPPAPPTVEEAQAVKAAMKALRRIDAERDLARTLKNTKTSSAKDSSNLPFHSEVLV